MLFSLNGLGQPRHHLSTSQRHKHKESQAAKLTIIDFVTQYKFCLRFYIQMVFILLTVR